MAKMNWWSTEWTERSALMDAQESLEYLDEAGMGMAEQIGKLFRIQKSQAQ